MAAKSIFSAQDLSQLNTFGLAVKAEKYAALEREEDLFPLREALGEERPFLLGGGSNVLFTRDVLEPVIGIRLKGLVACEDGDDVHLHVAAGENWHQLTQHCVQKGWGGFENLSLIPGQVGTAPVQNIGAYGVELKDVLTYVDAFDWKAGKMQRIAKADCAFAYRDSIFKSREKGRYLITAVGFKLSLKPELKTHYGAIQSELEKMGKQNNPDIADVARAVIRIRQSKLPDPAHIGNAGSFFKNPILPNAKAAALGERYPEIPTYRAEEGMTKVAAGWLIEKAGWKGHDRGSHGVHDRQALVLVNKGGASGAEVYQLARDIQEDISARFDIHLEMEVNIYPQT